MAKFSETFLQGLLTPTYQQTLTEAAKGAAMAPGLAIIEKERQEQQKNLQALITGAPTLERIAMLRSRAAGLMTTDPDRAKAINAAADGLQKQYDSLQDQRKVELSGEASRIASDASIGNIPQYVASLENVTDAERGSLIKQATTQRELVVSAAANDNAKVLEPEYARFVKNNPEVFKNNPSYQAAVRVRNLPAGERQVGDLVRANNLIRELVDKEAERQGVALFNAASVESKATGMITEFIGKSSNSTFIFGRDAVEAAREVYEDEDKQEQFVKFVGVEFEKDPNISPTLAVKNALDIMGEKIDLKLEAGRMANEQELAEERENAISFLMEEENLSREDAIRKINGLYYKTQSKKIEEATSATPSPPPAPPVVDPAPTPPPPPAPTPPPALTPRVSGGPLSIIGQRDAANRARTAEFLRQLNEEAKLRREAAAQRGTFMGRPLRNQ
tara:strand:- start:3219 stop:4559 length:1341 start_codon:yes stop_codon:yes gene_type:complete